MWMPGFGAEASLTHPSAARRHYRQSVVAGGPFSGALRPQQSSCAEIVCNDGSQSTGEYPKLRLSRTRQVRRHHVPGWQHEHGSVPELCLPCRPPVRGHHVLGRKLEHGQLPGLFLPGTAQLQRHHLSGSNDQHGHVSPMRLPDRSADRPAGANLPSRLDMSPWARSVWPMAGLRLQARRCSEPSSGNPDPGSVRRTFLSRPRRRRRVQSIFRVRRPSDEGTRRRKPTAYGRRR